MVIVEQLASGTTTLVTFEVIEVGLAALPFPSLPFPSCHRLTLWWLCCTRQSAEKVLLARDKLMVENVKVEVQLVKNQAALQDVLVALEGDGYSVDDFSPSPSSSSSALVGQTAVGLARCMHRCGSIVLRGGNGGCLAGCRRRFAMGLCWTRRSSCSWTRPLFSSI